MDAELCMGGYVKTVFEECDELEESSLQSGPHMVFRRKLSFVKMPILTLR